MTLDGSMGAKPVVYVETSVVSYLAARPSRDVVVAAYQQVTREWWRSAPDRFDLVASDLVVAEAGMGDRDAARARLAVLESVTLLEATGAAADLTLALIDSESVPRNAADDAAHIAIAVTNQVGFSGDVELPTHCQCSSAIPHRASVPAGGLHASGHLYAQRTDGAGT